MRSALVLPATLTLLALPRAASAWEYCTDSVNVCPSAHFVGP